MFSISRARCCPNGKGLTLTGQLGEVMQESAKIAQSYIWAHAAELGVDPTSIKDNGVHIHVPAGAIPKDGPSAGVTMTTAHGFALYWTARAKRYGDDRRSHADRLGIADRRRERESTGGPASRYSSRNPAAGQQKGFARTCPTTSGKRCSSTSWIA